VLLGAVGDHFDGIDEVLAARAQALEALIWRAILLLADG